MSKTTYIVLLIVGVIGVFAAFMFFSGNANAAEGMPDDYASRPYTGNANGTAPQGASGTGMPKAVKYTLYAVAPITYLTNASAVKSGWNKIKSIF